MNAVPSPMAVVRGKGHASCTSLSSASSMRVCRAGMREARVAVRSDGWEESTVARFVGRKVDSWAHLSELFPGTPATGRGAAGTEPLCVREADDVVLFWSPAGALDRDALRLGRMVGGGGGGGVGKGGEEEVARRWRAAWSRFPALARRLGLSDYARKLPVHVAGQGARKERLKASEASRLVPEPEPLRGALSVAFGATRSGEDNLNLSTMLADEEGREFCETVLRPTLLAQGEALERVAPERAEAMRDAVARGPGGVLGVPHFETVAISVNAALRFHRDVHDLGRGLSCMLCVHSEGAAVQGGDLVVPGLQCAEQGEAAVVLPMPHGAVTMFQAHRLWHATMPVGMPADHPDPARIQIISFCKEPKDHTSSAPSR